MQQPRSFQQIIGEAQQFLTREGIPGWLIYDYRHSNPIFRQVVTPSGHVTRPCFLFIPDSGPARLLTHHVDAGKFASEADGAGETGLELLVYSSRQTLLDYLGQVLSGRSQVAMEYSAHNVLAPGVPGGRRHGGTGAQPGAGGSILRRPDAIRDPALDAPAVGRTPTGCRQAGADSQPGFSTHRGAVG